MARYEAVSLFVERARSRLSTFALTSENAPAVAEACRRLDGVPLAIELAAARVGVLSVEQITARLEDSLKLLSGGSRTAPPRHRTLRATLAWGHELLSDPERELFERLSVFAGGWTLEGAEAVGAGGGVREEDVLDLLASLVDKSLVAMEASPGAEQGPRYRMLESVRQYGRERLEGSGAADSVRRRHAAWVLALAEQAGTESGEQGAWLERLGAEQDNVRASLGWALDREGEDPEGRAEMGLSLAAGLAQGRFWAAYGIGEGLTWLERGLARDSTSPRPVRINALNEAGYLAIWAGDHERAVALLEESFAISRGLGNELGVAASLFQLGHAVLQLEDHRVRIEVLREEAETLRRESSDRWATAFLLLFLGMISLDEHDYERMVALLEESLALFREPNDLRGIGMCLTVMGQTALDKGDGERAAVLFEEATRVLRELRDKVGTFYCLLGVAGVAGARRRSNRAARLWGAAEALREAAGFSMSPFTRNVYDYDGHLAAARAQLDAEAWDAAWAEGRAMTPEQAVEYALEEPSRIDIGAQPQAPPTRVPMVPARPLFEPLTARELEVLGLISDGLSNQQIAARLYIAVSTVKGYINIIFKKLGVQTRTQAVAEARKRRLSPE